MNCPRYESTKANNTEKDSAAAESKIHHLKASPVKELSPIKPLCPPAELTTVLLPPSSDTSAVHNKENSASREHHDRSLDEGFEDSGYLSLHSSQVDSHHVDEEDEQILGKRSAAARHQEKKLPLNDSPKWQARTDPVCPVSLVAVSTPVDRPRRRTATYSLSSTPKHSDPNLPILKFQQAVCEELAKSYQKNKKYDWSIVAKVAEDHLLDRVIGGHMGLEYVDIFTSLLSRNMKRILTNILAMLGEMDLISCKKVSKTWRKIICEDTAALSRCQKAEQAFRESRSSLACGLTRDLAVSRVVLSCMQAVASSSSPQSSTSGCGMNRRTAPSQRGSTLSSQCTRFNEYVQATNSLKQHESLRSCKRCGSPATHLPEVQRATCKRLSCLFDFCTRCKEAFHGSTPCRTVQSRAGFSSSKISPLVPGSTRSKRSIRRL